jgi:hypothetical protein
MSRRWRVVFLAVLLLNASLLSLLVYSHAWTAQPSSSGGPTFWRNWLTGQTRLCTRRGCWKPGDVPPDMERVACRGDETGLTRAECEAHGLLSPHQGPHALKPKGTFTGTSRAAAVDRNAQVRENLDTGG